MENAAEWVMNVLLRLLIRRMHLRIHGQNNSKVTDRDVYVRTGQKEMEKADCQKREQ